MPDRIGIGVHLVQAIHHGIGCAVLQEHIAAVGLVALEHPATEEFVHLDHLCIVIAPGLLRVDAAVGPEAVKEALHQVHVPVLPGVVDDLPFERRGDGSQAVDVLGQRVDIGEGTGEGRGEVQLIHRLQVVVVVHRVVALEELLTAGDQLVLAVAYLDGQQVIARRQRADVELGHHRLDRLRLGPLDLLVLAEHGGLVRVLDLVAQQVEAVRPEVRVSAIDLHIKVQGGNGLREVIAQQRHHLVSVFRTGGLCGGFDAFREENIRDRYIRGEGANGQWRVIAGHGRVRTVQVPQFNAEVIGAGCEVEELLVQQVELQRVQPFWAENLGLREGFDVTRFALDGRRRNIGRA